MRENNYYRIVGGLMCVVAILFVAFAFFHPEFSFPWSNGVTYTLYVLYILYAVLMFCMPKLKGASLRVCLIIAVQFIAVVFLALSITMRHDAGESNWYLPIALCLTTAANFANLSRNKKTQEKEAVDE